MRFNKLKLIIVPVAVILLLLPVLNYFKPFGFFFTGTLAEHRAWFPTFYFLSFILFKSFYPLAYAAGLYLILRRRLSTQVLLFLIVIQSALIVACMETIGFVPVSLYAYLLAGAPVLFRLQVSSGHFFSQFTGWLFNSKLLAGSFLFVIYIILCLNLNRFHPFAKYTMFNRFPESTKVFLLRDSRDSLLPLNTYCNIDGNHLFELYVAISHQHGFKYGAGGEKKEEQLIVSREMMETIFKNLKKPIPSDSVKLSVINFYLEHGKLNSNETQLYTCKAE